jgi:hypothetical protein
MIPSPFAELLYLSQNRPASFPSTSGRHQQTDSHSKANSRGKANHVRDDPLVVASRFSNSAIEGSTSIVFDCG